MNARTATPGPRSATRALVAAIAFGALAAACSADPAGQARDVGNMAYPQPLPQGNLNNTAVAGRLPLDTGNMAYPDPVPAGVIGRVTATRQGFDTGNMAYPAPRPEGNGPVTVVK